MVHGSTINQTSEQYEESVQVLIRCSALEIIELKDLPIRQMSKGQQLKIRTSEVSCMWDYAEVDSKTERTRKFYFGTN